MADTKYRKGQDFLVYVKNSGNTEAERVAYSKTCAVEIKINMIETSSPDTGTWKTAIPGKGEWSVSVGGLVADGERNDATLWKILADRQKVYIYYCDTAGSGYWQGQAYLTDLKQNAELRKAVTYEATFRGDGALVFVE